MEVFDCTCKWRFIVGEKRVYGPIYEIGLPGHRIGPDGCYTRGRMMSRERFEDEYGACALRFEIKEREAIP